MRGAGKMVLLLSLMTGGVCGLITAACGAESKAFHYDSHGRRDPFEPLVTPTGELHTPRSGGAIGALHVDGVLWDPVTPLAIVNGEVRRVGEEVEGYRIAEIRTNAIVVDGSDAGRLVVPVMVEGAGSAAQ